MENGLGRGAQEAREEEGECNAQIEMDEKDVGREAPQRSNTHLLLLAAQAPPLLAHGVGRRLGGRAAEVAAGAPLHQVHHVAGQGPLGGPVVLDLEVPVAHRLPPPPRAGDLPLDLVEEAAGVVGGADFDDGVRVDPLVVGALVGDFVLVCDILQALLPPGGFVSYDIRPGMHTSCTARCDPREGGERERERAFVSSPGLPPPAAP